MRFFDRRTISNYAYLGYVLVEALFGPSGLIDMILFCIPFALYTYTFGYALLTGKGSFWKKLLNPMMAAIFLGCVFGLSEISVPDVLASVLNVPSVCTGPLSMLLTGLVLSSFAAKDFIPNGRLFVFLSARLVFCRVVAFFAFIVDVDLFHWCHGTPFYNFFEPFAKI